MPLWLGKIIATRIIKAIKRKIDLKKIDKYVNKPNELDKQMKQVHKNVTKNGKNIEGLEKEVAILKRDSHPQSDWIYLKCGCKAKKVEKPTRKRRKRKLKKEK
jgi:S-adenosylmethionine synthetase